MNSAEGQGFRLPGKLEKLVATMAGDYGRQGDRLMQELLVNSTYHVEEAVDYDGIDGGQTYHAVHFQVPASVLYQISNRVHDIKQEFTQRLNDLSTCRQEHILDVLFELQDGDLANWRENSGVLIRKNKLASTATNDELDKLWQKGYLRVFLSHKAEYKKETAQLKEALLSFGVTCFVAHEDVEPTAEWEKEIVKALSSMEAMVPLLTTDFGNSKWTDQEVGVAVSQGVPIIPVRLGLDPYGFIGKYQAVAGQDKTPQVLARKIFELLFTKYPSIKEAVVGALVTRFEQAQSFAHANQLMFFLDQLPHASPGIIERLERAPQANTQVEGANNVNRKLPELLARLKGKQ